MLQTLRFPFTNTLRRPEIPDVPRFHFLLQHYNPGHQHLASALGDMTKTDLRPLPANNLDPAKARPTNRRPRLKDATICPMSCSKYFGKVFHHLSGPNADMRVP